ncbi:MAG: glucose-6-phosphate dehydrogenase [Chloroflexi bacterium]|nr:MAG: glucose-6-phosphate dehydrogenase [Chloroflexota bacterium]
MKNTTIVIFGASGDLSQRKLGPGLYSLFQKKRLPEKLNIVGYSSSKLMDGGFIERLRKGVEQFREGSLDEETWQDFSKHLHYQSGGLTSIEDFHSLAARLKQLEAGPANRLYYLATPPQFFAEIVTCLGTIGMTDQTEGWRRVVVEKPYGTDVLSARQLNKQLRAILDEEQIYRIDHYLGKETVQNILTFRFANSFYEPIWNHNFIDHIQISVAEKVNLGNRAGYFDGIGTLRDMFQNHLFELLSLISMEPPATFQVEDLREAKVKALHAVRPLSSQDVEVSTVRGQYKGYRNISGVAPDSNTETYAALRLYLDNPRWQEVPFYLRSGKYLAEKSTEIIIQFKAMPFPIGGENRIGSMSPNILSFCLQPDEGFHQRFEVKVPDTQAETRPVEMVFHYRDAFGEATIPEAYERLLLDALNGDASLFTRGDRAELAWELLEPVMKAWHSPNGPDLHIYEPLSWGPKAADDLIEKDGRSWLRVCGIHKADALQPILI